MQPSKLRTILLSLWAAVSPSLISQLKEYLVKKFVYTLLKTNVGFQAWLVALIAKEFIDEVGEPIIKAVWVEAGYVYYVTDGGILITKLKTAKDENDEAGYNSTVDDINS